MGNVKGSGLLNAEARYESHVDRSGGPDVCHPWTGTLDRGGYGSFWDGTQTASGRQRMVGAHRWGFEHYVGPLGRLHVRHTCDFRPCQNRRHWIKGTNLDNVQDREARGRGVAYTTERVRGSRNPAAKITEDTVRLIRRRCASETHAAVARDLGISRATVSMIMSGKTWRHVE